VFDVKGTTLKVVHFGCRGGRIIIKVTYCLPLFYTPALICFWTVEKVRANIFFSSQMCFIHKLAILVSIFVNDHHIAFKTDFSRQRFSRYCGGSFWDDFELKWHKWWGYWIGKVKWRNTKSVESSQKCTFLLRNIPLCVSVWNGSGRGGRAYVNKLTRFSFSLMCTWQIWFSKKEWIKNDWIFVARFIRKKKSGAWADHLDEKSEVTFVFVGLSAFIRFPSSNGRLTRWEWWTREQHWNSHQNVLRLDSE